MPHHSQCTVVSDKLESNSPSQSPGLTPALTIPSSKAPESPERTAPEVSIPTISNVPSQGEEWGKWPGLTAMTKDEEANFAPFVRWVVKHRTDQSSCAANDKPVGKLASTLPFVCSQLYEYQRREFWTVFYHHFYSFGCPPDLAIRDFVDGAKLIDWDKKWGHTTILGHSHTYLFLAHDRLPEPSIIPSGFMSRNARVAMLSKLGLSCAEPKRIPQTFAAAAKAKVQPKDLAFAFKDNGQSYMDRKVPVTLALPITMESHGFDVDGVVHEEDKRCQVEFSYRMPGAESLCSIWMRDDATVGDAVRAITKRYSVTDCCLVAANPRPVHMATLICELTSVCSLLSAPHSTCIVKAVVKANPPQGTAKDEPNTTAITPGLGEMNPKVAELPFLSEVISSDDSHYNLSFVGPADPTEDNITFLDGLCSEMMRPGCAVAMTLGQPPSSVTSVFYEATAHPLLANWRCYVKFNQYRSLSCWWNFSICEYGVGVTRLVQMRTGTPKMTPADVLQWLFGSQEVRQTDCCTLVRLLPEGKAEVADLRFHADVLLHYTDSLVLYVKPRLATKPFTRYPVDTVFPVLLHCEGETKKLTLVADQPTEASIAKPLLVYLCRLWNLIPSVVAPWMVAVDQEAPPLPGRISITKVISNDIPGFEVFVNVQDKSLHQQQYWTLDASESLFYSPNESPEWNQHAAILQSMNALPSVLPLSWSVCFDEECTLGAYRSRFESFHGEESCRSDGFYCCFDQHCNMEHRCVFCDSCGHGFGDKCGPWSSLVMQSDSWGYSWERRIR